MMKERTISGIYRVPSCPKTPFIEIAECRGCEYNEAVERDYVMCQAEHQNTISPSYTELVEFARWTQKFWKNGIEIMRKNGLVIDNLDDNMQKLAFTFYTDLCEINSAAEHLFQEGYGEENYKEDR